MAHYVAGQEVMCYTCDEKGDLGPFMNEVTNQPVSPTVVVFKFRLEPDSGSPGATNTVTSGTPLNFDSWNPDIIIVQDLVTKGYWVTLVTTGFFGPFPGVASVNLRTQWESLDPNNPAMSQSKVDTIWPAAL